MKRTSLSLRRKWIYLGLTKSHFIHTKHNLLLTRSNIMYRVISSTCLGLIILCSVCILFKPNICSIHQYIFLYFFRERFYTFSSEKVWASRPNQKWGWRDLSLESRLLVECWIRTVVSPSSSILIVSHRCGDQETRDQNMLIQLYIARSTTTILTTEGS